MDRPIVLITHPDVANYTTCMKLLQIKCDIIMCKSQIPKREEIMKKCKGVSAILWTPTDILIDMELLTAAGTDLKIISVLSYNDNFIDYDAVHASNVNLVYTPELSKHTIAEYAIALLLFTARRLADARIAIQKSLLSIWSPIHLVGADIRGYTAGFFGMNLIGLEIVKRLRGFNISKFIYTNKKFQSNNKCLIPVDFEQLLKESHFLFITCPLTDKTKSLFNDNVFEKLSEKCILINISHARIINQNSLYHALKNKKIYGAGLDTCYPEPLPKNHLLLGLSNYVLTPNIKNLTLATREEIVTLGIENVINALSDKEVWLTNFSKLGTRIEEFDF